MSVSNPTPHPPTERNTHLIVYFTPCDHNTPPTVTTRVTNITSSPPKKNSRHEAGQDRKFIQQIFDNFSLNVSRGWLRNCRRGWLKIDIWYLVLLGIKTSQCLLSSKYLTVSILEWSYYCTSTLYPPVPSLPSPSGVCYDK